MAHIPNHIRVWGRGAGRMTETGMDQYDQCLPDTRKHFETYPWPVEYNFNSRGFRDDEWSNNFDELKSAVWCLGDSFTLGIGSPREHTWPYQVGKLTGCKVMNCSMDGASNEWLSDLAINILDSFDPPNLVIMWSYTHRRVGIGAQTENKIVYDQVPQWKITYDAIRDIFWPRCNTLAQFNALPIEIQQQVLDRIGEDQFRNDLESRVHYVKSTDEDDLENFKDCIQRVQQYQRQRVVHASIPQFAPNNEYTPRTRAVLEQQSHWIPAFERLDRARDYHHFDIKTSQWIAEQIQPLLL